jgi:hypothetical protein
VKRGVDNQLDTKLGWAKQEIMHNFCGKISWKAMIWNTKKDTGR